jgi:hypothetical protein
MTDGWLVKSDSNAWMDPFTHKWHDDLKDICCVYNNLKAALRVGMQSSSCAVIPMTLTSDGYYATEDGHIPLMGEDKIRRYHREKDNGR